MLSGSPRSVLLALLLLDASAVVLWLGGFVQFDDTSGFGSNEWVLPLGYLALVLAAAGVAVAWRDRRARRPAGLWLLAVTGFVAACAVVDPGFRFVWGVEEGELAVLILALALAGLALAATARITAYAVALVAALVLGFVAGMRNFEEENCGGSDFDGECDLAGLEGLVWSAAAVLLVMTGIVVLEIRRHRHRDASASAEATR